MSEKDLSNEKSGRRGPTPLPVHLAAMMLRAGGDVERLGAALRGIELWRNHPFKRPESGGDIICRIGGSRLIDTGGSGHPVLLAPSLVNPASILDLLPGNSLARGLRLAGFRILLIDWGTPGAEERAFGIADYVERLSLFASRVAAEHGAVPHLLGYCMGGTLAAALALTTPGCIGRLALLAAPWDFHAGDKRPGRLGRAALPLLPLIARLGMAPNELVQGFFASLNPGAGLDKFAAFAAMDSTGAEAELFVALEDWANGGAPLAPILATEVLRDWYAHNLPGSGLWAPFGEKLDPAKLTMPVFAAVPKRDRIVPPASALGLAACPERLTLIRPSSGHVGMVVGRRAPHDLIGPLANWLAVRE